MFTFKPTIEKKKEEHDSDSDNDSIEELRNRVYQGRYQSPIYTVRRLQVRDGDIVYFWDCTEPLKTLSDEEKRAILLKERSLKSKKSRYHDREESLHIQERDVEIDE